ncbi:MAG TPA: PqqD family protein [Acidimicrobiia bacterium]|nr:PqqD family protein [Acidimicrobiia bacterium]
MVYRRAEGVLSEVLDGKAMLVASDGTELITLNSTGTAVWDALANEGDPAAIAERLHETRPDVARDQLEADVRVFLTELEGAALVVQE